ncbi:hypothetical protein F4212_14200 [Candidatus Poribacteria bacterium]|nr:hypothetical protein [Candidatus Poribacteria bacterium]
MKPLFRLMMIFATALLFVSLIGCGADDDEDVVDDKDDDTAEVMLDFVDTTWQVATINGVTFEQLFTSAEPEPGDPVFETEFMLGANNWVFNDDGTFTGALEFIVTEKYPEPVSSMKQEITIASEGTYTTEASTLTIATHDLSIDVVVTLEPKEVWEQQIVGITVEEFEMNLAAETKEGFSPTATGALFKAGTTYTWSVDGDSLMLTGAIQKLVLKKASE